MLLGLRNLYRHQNPDWWGHQVIDSVVIATCQILSVSHGVQRDISDMECRVRQTAHLEQLLAS